MNNSSRYLFGIIFGLCGEYLFRVEFNIYPLIIMILIIIIWFLDVITKLWSEK
jgi:hypothetical protein